MKEESNYSIQPPPGCSLSQLDARATNDDVTQPIVSMVPKQSRACYIWASLLAYGPVAVHGEHRGHCSTMYGQVWPHHCRAFLLYYHDIVFRCFETTLCYG
jgi:hypothetical protein